MVPLLMEANHRSRLMLWGDYPKVKYSPNSVTTAAFKRVMFISNKFGHFIPVTKKNIYSLYARKERKLRLYLQNRFVDFSSRKDLIALIAFMDTH